MLDLALHNTGECIKVKEIANRQGISEKYLEQIIAILNKAGYVCSVLSWWDSAEHALVLSPLFLHRVQRVT